MVIVPSVRFVEERWWALLGNSKKIGELINLADKLRKKSGKISIEVEIENIWKLLGLGKNKEPFFEVQVLGLNGEPFIEYKCTVERAKVVVTDNESKIILYFDAVKYAERETFRKAIYDYAISKKEKNSELKHVDLDNFRKIIDQLWEKVVPYTCLPAARFEFHLIVNYNKNAKFMHIDGGQLRSKVPNTYWSLSSKDWIRSFMQSVNYTYPFEVVVFAGEVSREFCENLGNAIKIGFLEAIDELSKHLQS